MGQQPSRGNQWKPGPKRKKAKHIQAWLSSEDEHQKHAIKIFEAYRREGESPATILTMALDALGQKDVAERITPKYRTDGERIDNLERKLAELVRLLEAGHFTSDEEYSSIAHEYDHTYRELSTIQQSIANRYEPINTDAVDFEDDDWGDEGL